MIRGLLPLPIAKDLDVNQPTSCCRARCAGGTYCHNCDLLVGLEGLHVTDVRREPELLTVSVESASGLTGCPSCGEGGRGAQPAGGASGRRAPFRHPGRVAVAQAALPVPRGRLRGGHVHRAGIQHGAPAGMLTARAARWAITQIRSEHASVQGVVRQLSVRWRTVWSAIKPILDAAAEDGFRLTGVSTLGVDEHGWPHVYT